ncbi:5-formyltetrahydrofolate cyclo-ligase [Acinetobacter sp. UBA1297]|uniref:5-formyltetrahydrofolate cyclo-ligase n=1 Tax=Acinetobacter sp. UBA1297 TaxID=1945925 RepID=UPI00257A9BF7|nr:5-formyltetrahydrofolate cyclo-ligase [Acinetobacter sp. UBA1297]
MSISLHSLRRSLRSQRRQVSIFEHRQSEQKVLTHLIKMPRFQHADKIGIYLNAFGEIHTRKIIEYCFKKGKKVYLPMICNMNQKLVWVSISRDQYRNQCFAYHPLGMKEPMAGRGCNVTVLDLILMPLLACDSSGTRIGMGGGYYDRTLAQAAQYPYRLGLAHDFQFIPLRLKREKWDQPLNALVTPTKIHYF